MNKRKEATNIANERETVLMNYLTDDYIIEDTLAVFPCSKEAFLSLLPTFKQVEPTFTKVTKAGGLGNHKDLQLVCADTIKGIELKVSDAKLTKELLEWQPWEGGVQFLQGQITSALMSSFLGSCGRPMVAAWFEKVKVLMATHLPLFTIPTLEDYTKLLFTLGSEKKLTTPAAKLIQELRAKENLRQLFQDAWLLFENEWFSANTPDVEAFRKVLQQILGEKDYWVNINKGGAFLIEGFTVVNLEYVGTAKKAKGGTVFRYMMTLQKKKRGDVKQVPIVLKFYWKNGGQGVQNINLLVVSDTFA